MQPYPHLHSPSMMLPYLHLMMLPFPHLHSLPRRCSLFLISILFLSVVQVCLGLVDCPQEEQTHQLKLHHVVRQVVVGVFLWGGGGGSCGGLCALLID